MALIVEDGTGVTGADSFASIEYADAYCVSRGKKAWAAVKAPDKEVLLREASRDVSLLFKFKGTVMLTYQPLALPTTLINDVPERVKEATVEMALLRLAGLDPTGPVDPASNIKSVEKSSGKFSKKTEFFNAGQSETAMAMRKIKLLLGDLIDTSVGSLFVRVDRG